MQWTFRRLLTMGVTAALCTLTCTAQAQIRMFAADYFGGKIRAISLDGNTITTYLNIYAPSYPLGDALGNLYVVSGTGSSATLVKIAPDTTFNPLVFNVPSPSWLAQDTTGKLYMANANGLFLVDTVNSLLISRYSSATVGSLAGLYYDPTNNFLYTNSLYPIGGGGLAWKVLKLDPAGVANPVIITTTQGLFGEATPTGITRAYDGLLYLSAGKIFTVTEQGVVHPFVGDNQSFYTGIALQGNKLYTGYAPGSDDIFRIDLQGNIAPFAPGIPSIGLTFNSLPAVLAWGANYYAQLGTGDYTNRSLAGAVNTAGTSPTLTTAQKLAAGFGHSLAVDPSGNLFAWGNNQYGQLGLGTITNTNTKKPTFILDQVTEIAAGSWHSLAIQAGSVHAWGNNLFGQLGDGTIYAQGSPEDLSYSAERVAAGGYHSLLVDGGSLYAWGYNVAGQLGDGTNINRTTPQPITLPPVAEVAAGLLHSVALTTTGDVYTWGYNYYGQLGNNTRIDTNQPFHAPILANIKAIAAGGYHTLALDNDGNLWAWGRNDVGQLGIGSLVRQTSPVKVTNQGNYVAIAAGLFHSLAVDKFGNLYAWGHNGYGQLGDNTHFLSSAPKHVPGMGVSVIAAGAYFNLMD